MFQKRLFFIPLCVFIFACNSKSKSVVLPDALHTKNSKMFKEPLNTAVFTTKFVLTDKKDITVVNHNADDNSWEFYSDDKTDDFEKVAKVISLKQIINIDESILELSDMKGGFYAHRNSKKDSWIVASLQNK